ncbi:hypothetical protein JCM10207_000969 [Rhodosporidiobolus poonsookiae]
MATPRPSHGHHPTASSSRLSLASEATTRNPTPQPLPAAQTVAEGTHAIKYSISSVLAEPTPSASLLPALPTLPSASTYLPSQLSSLSTAFSSAGTLPRSATPNVKQVAQRRAQAPPIVVTELRKVSRTEFEPYLAELGDDYERWEKEARLDRAGIVGLGDDGATEDGAVGLGLGGGAGAGVGRVRGDNSKHKQKAEEALPPLADVPPIFFDGDFNLSNPRTFDLVTERVQLSPSSSPHLSSSSSGFPSAPSTPPMRAGAPTPGLGPSTLNDLATDQVLQDKLSHYTAVVESHLVREIGLRSASFFAALANLQSLHQQGEDTLGKISELQAALSSSSPPSVPSSASAATTALEAGGVGRSAQRGLAILRLQARRRGLERLDDAVRAVEDVWAAVEGVKELVEHGEWDGALEVAEGVEDAYFASASPSSSSSSSSPAPASPASDAPAVQTTSKRPRLNLTKLSALRWVPARLALLRGQVAKALEGELVGVLEHEMDVGIEESVRGAKAGEREKEGRGETAASVVARLVSGGAAAAAAAPSNTPSGSRAPSLLEGVPEEAEEPDEAEEQADSPDARAKERALDRVRPVVRALVRAEGMDSAVAAWRESVLREVRALVREHLPTTGTPSPEDEDQFAQAAIRAVSKQSIDLGTISEKSLSLAKKLRALPHADFLALADETYLGLLACIEVVDLHARVLLELVVQSRAEEQARKARRRRPASDPLQQQQQPVSPSGATLAVPGATPAPTVTVSAPADTRAAPSAASTTSEDSSTLLTEISDVVSAVAELANVRFSKVIGVRTEVHAHLSLADFVAIFDRSWRFVLACEVVCQRMIVGLRGAMVGQAKAFLQTFHQRQITDSAKVVEEEQWAAAEVPAQVQRMVEVIVRAAMADPVELLLGERRAARAIATVDDQQANGTDTSSNGAAEGEGSNGVEADEKAAVPGPAKQVDIEGRQFFVVPAGLTTIGVLVEYLKVLLNCPMLTTDCMSKIIEFMKAFNSRTCQVVLGAGAMRSAGLKNITAKHLALASQALSVMVSLIPYIRECVRRHLNPKQAVMLTEFDKLKRDYQEHQHEIHAKLVAIMSDRLQVHSRTLESINWEEPSPRPESPNTYMEGLVKEHLTLHKVLSRFLQPETVQHILSQAFAGLDARLGEVLGGVELRSLLAKERMLVDVRYLREKLGDLKGLEEQGPGKDLEALVQSKPLPKPAVVPRPSLPPRTSSIAPPSAPSAPAPAQPSASPAPGSASPLPPLPADSSAPLSTNPSASASTASLALPTSTPRTSLDDSTAAPRSPTQPPSPVPVPEPLPAPAPYVSKKKSLAERLAERMTKKPAVAVAPTVEEQKVDSSANGAGSARPSVEVPTIVEPAAAPSVAPPADEDAAAPPADAPASNGEPASTSAEPQLATDAPPTPNTELNGLRLELGEAGVVEAEAVATPAREELEEVEREVEREMAGEAGEVVEETPAPAPASVSEDVMAVDTTAEAVELPAQTGEDSVEQPEAVVASVEEGPVPQSVTEQQDVVPNGDLAGDNAVIGPEPAAPSSTEIKAGEPMEEVVQEQSPAPPLEDVAEPVVEAEKAPEPEPAEEPAAPASSAPVIVEAADHVSASTSDEPAPSSTGAEPDAAPPLVEEQPSSAAAPTSSDSNVTVQAPTGAPDVPEPVPVAASAPAPAPVDEPVPAPAPAAEPTPASPASSIASPSLIASDAPLSPPTAPARKKTLKERLAEAARKRGSLSGSMVESPPLAAATVAPVQEEKADAGPNGASAGADKVQEKELVQSPEIAKVELPPPVPVVEPDTAPAPAEEAAEKKEEERVEEPIEEEESSFL